MKSHDNHPSIYFLVRDVSVYEYYSRALIPWEFTSRLLCYSLSLNWITSPSLEVALHCHNWSSNHLLSSGGVRVGSSEVKSVSKLETSVSLVTSGLNGGSIWISNHSSRIIATAENDWEIVGYVLGSVQSTCWWLGRAVSYTHLTLPTIYSV